MKIVAVVVTHNRCTLLARCLDYLHQQSRAPDSILVINNSSTDDTEQMLQSRGVAFITQENVGSAGGWHRGIQYAIDNGFDAVWLMDDDGYPDMHALEYLEAALEPGTSCVSSVVLRENQPTHFVFPFPRLNEHGLPVIFSRQRKIPTLNGLARHAEHSRYPFVHFFNGALLAIGSARQIGNVDQRFFIFGDEVDYFFRLRQVGTVYSVLAAHHYHPDVTIRSLSDVKVYYYIKNTLILNRRYFDHAWLRNVLTVIAALVRTGSRNGWHEAFAYLLGSKQPVLFSAITRGLRGQVGKDFNG